MNVSQIIRLAAFNADAIKKAGTLAPFVTEEELLSWANEGNRKLEAKLRQTRANYFTRTLNSSTSNPEKIMGINYVPQVSLKMNVGENYLTLPPDFQELTFIKFVTSGYENTPITRMPYQHEEFRARFRDAGNRTPGVEVFYDILNQRDLMFVPKLASAMDIEIRYVARTKNLFYYSTGTVTVADSALQVDGSGTKWLSGGPFDSAYLDVMFGSVGTSPTASSHLVYDNTTRCRVASIDTDTRLQLAAGKINAATGVNYLLTSVPVYDESYHYNLSDYISFKILSKAGDPQATRAMQSWPDNIGDLLTTAARRQSADHEVVEDWNPWS